MAVIQFISDCPPLPEVDGVEIRHCCKFPGYAVGSDGSLWSCWPRGAQTHALPWKRRRVRRDRLGYRSTTMKDAATGKTIMRGIAPIVCEAFHGPCPDGMECCHNDSVRDNDTAENLRWDTHKNNMADAVLRKSWANRPKQLGDANSFAKLTANQVRLIRKMVCNKITTKTKIAEMFGISPQNICDIMAGRSWKHLK